MKMDSMIRNIVILTSLIIFCYQLYTALHNLMSNTSVDSTEKIPISDLEYPPLITICPRQREDEKTVRELGYFDIHFLMKGNNRQR